MSERITFVRNELDQSAISGWDERHVAELESRFLINEEKAPHDREPPTSLNSTLAEVIKSCSIAS